MQRRGTSRPLVVGHRGSSGTAPENTLASFALAIEEGVGMIELDVRMTKDFELVVFHDRNLRRTTNGRGFIWNYTLDELRHLDAGSWYSARFKGERIPTLRQVIDFLPPHCRLNIEVKTDGEERRRIAFEEACILVLKEKNFLHRAVVSSFDHRFLKRLHKLEPALPIGALFLPMRDIGKKPSSFRKTLGASMFVCNRTQLRQRYVLDAHLHDMSLMCYTVNTARGLQRMLRYGVDAIVTDYPGRMQRALDRIHDS